MGAPRVVRRQLPFSMTCAPTWSISLPWLSRTVAMSFRCRGVSAASSRSAGGDLRRTAGTRSSVTIETRREDYRSRLVIAAVTTSAHLDEVASSSLTLEPITDLEGRHDMARIRGVDLETTTQLRHV